MVIYEVIIMVLCLAVIIAMFWAIDSSNKLAKEHREHLETVNAVYEQTASYIAVFKSEVEKANSLIALYILHIQIWAAGIHSTAFSPNSTMFRTSDIVLMKPEEVWIPDSSGNFINLKVWSVCSESSREKYSAAVETYKNQLLEGLNNW